MTGTTLSLGHLLALVTHELRSPASVVSGSLRLLTSERSDPLTDRQRRILAPAHRASDRVVELLEDLSELSKLVRGEAVFFRRQLAVADLLREARDRFTPPPETSIELDVRNSADGSLFVDADRLSRAVAELARAAGRAMGSSGRVTLTADVPGGSDRAELVIQPGIPIPSLDGTPGTPDLTDYVEGVGFELPIARLIIEAEHGRLHVTPERVRITLPLTDRGATE